MWDGGAAFLFRVHAFAFYLPMEVKLIIRMFLTTSPWLGQIS